MRMHSVFGIAGAVLIALLAACTRTPRPSGPVSPSPPPWAITTPTTPSTPTSPVPSSPTIQVPSAPLPPQVPVISTPSYPSSSLPPPPPRPVKVEENTYLRMASWAEIDGWYTGEQDFLGVFQAFRSSCGTLGKQARWSNVCTAAERIFIGSHADARSFFEKYFTPYQVRNKDGSVEGLLTGYYTPELRGSRVQTSRYNYPLYGAPHDLLVLDLAAVYPNLPKNMRGRLDGKKVVPYWSRAQIEGAGKPLRGQELFWVDNPVELFYLQIQGSGRIAMDNGERVMVGYAERNGHPFRSISTALLKAGAMSRDQMSMQNIRTWVMADPARRLSILNENPCFIFFRELPKQFQTPPGALGVPLTPRRSLAVDKSVIPLGAPVFVSTTWPNNATPLKRAMLAQDVGVAITGGVRGDFFWGVGDEAGQLAGRTKQKCRFWTLLPR